jgi:hypothetical protein
MPNTEIFNCKHCSKAYSVRNSLWYHEKRCIYSEKIDKEESNNVQLGLKNDSSPQELDCDALTHLFFDSMKQNQEFQKQMFEMVKETMNAMVTTSGTSNIITNNNKIHNTTNNTQFNLNFFLNETCKDAMNIYDFMESIQIQLEDLDYTGENGYVEGVSRIFLRELNKLDVCKRPIHCTDVKRDTMYIKEKEKWEKAEKHEKMKNTILKIANKERNAISAWVDINPDWFDTEVKQMEYLTLINKVCEPIENDIKNEKKIIKNIGKEIVLNKETEKLLMLK